MKIHALLSTVRTKLKIHLPSEQDELELTTREEDIQPNLRNSEQNKLLVNPN